MFIATLCLLKERLEYVHFSAWNLNENRSMFYSLHHPWLQEIPVGQEDPYHPFHPVLLEVRLGQSNQDVPKQARRKYS